MIAYLIDSDILVCEDAHAEVLVGVEDGPVELPQVFEVEEPHSVVDASHLSRIGVDDDQVVLIDSLCLEWSH